jgi:hypothetical protein
MAQDTTKDDEKHVILIVWHWNVGNKITDGSFPDQWRTQSGNEILLLSDVRNTDEEVITLLLDKIKAYRDVIVLLHENHGYREADIINLTKKGKERKQNIRAFLFGYAEGPLYIDKHDLGILGSGGRFANKYSRTQPDGSKKYYESKFVINEETAIINQEHFDHVWKIYQYASPRDYAGLLLHDYGHYIHTGREPEKPFLAYLKENNELFQEIYSLAYEEPAFNMPPIANQLLRFRDALKGDTATEYAEKKDTLLQMFAALQERFKSVLEEKVSVTEEPFCGILKKLLLELS